ASSSGASDSAKAENGIMEKIISSDRSRDTIRSLWNVLDRFPHGFRAAFLRRENVIVWGQTYVSAVAFHFGSPPESIIRTSWLPCPFSYNRCFFCQH
ncbi:MAG: hypothetical protein MR219_08610, partial [Clostridiales bacterium]|nr:hypothetical protein [Clostridiales bacterium]